ncbi:MAG: hypothetical protein KDB06_04930 [Ilumatobacter sp.]|nr:hypothetical protein [Ilumatobacter sp.]
MTEPAFAEYLAAQPEPQRTTLLVVAERLRRLLPDAEACISYGMPGFRVDGTVVAGFAGFKGHCSYFPHSGDVIRRLPAGAVLDHQWRDGTLRFPVDQPLSAALLRKLVEARLDLENEKGDVGPVARRFYANGRLAQKGKRRNGHMHGDWSFWRKDGSLMRTGTFKDGVQTGIWRTYDRDGFVVKETTF